MVEEDFEILQPILQVFSEKSDQEKKTNERVMGDFLVGLIVRYLVWECHMYLWS